MHSSYEPYVPRPVESHGRMQRSGHELKLYSIRYGGAPIDLDAYGEGIEMALSRLPHADPEAGRPGLGFLIVHRGRGMDYVVLAWWDRENELPVRVFVRPDEDWRPAGESESFCVWDLEVMNHERNAYVETVLREKPDGAEAYLRRVL